MIGIAQPAAAAPNDTVKVAGLCAGVQSRAGTNQTVYISETITLQGGYTNTLSGWLFSDPVANTTVLDAINAGHLIYTTKPVTIDILPLQHGSAATIIVVVPWRTLLTIIVNESTLPVWQQRR